MPAQVCVIAGPARSGKTGRALDHYREMLRSAPPRSGLWLAPTWRAAAAVQPRLLDGSLAACFNPGVMTFQRLADQVLQFSPLAIRPLTPLMKRHLIRRLIDEQLAAGKIRHFRSIAQTSGLVDLVAGWIGELKRLEIWPDQYRLACEAIGMTRRDAELLEIYDAYQRCLNEYQLYDAEGRLWSARALLREAVEKGSGSVYRNGPSDGGARPKSYLPPFLHHLRLVVVDGFADFTRTEHEILQILAERAEELLVTFTLEEPPCRDDLLAKPAKAWSELRRRHAHLKCENLPRPSDPPWKAMAHLERRLFGNPRQAVAAATTDGLEILAAARQLGEMELIGSRIKQLLTGSDPTAPGPPVRPGDIAVVMRRPQDVEQLVREVFGELGIPFALEAGQGLAQSPALSALVALLRLDAEDWPFRNLLAVLGSNYFRPPWPELGDGQALAAVERTVRELEIPRGRRELLDQLRRQAAAPEDALQVDAEDDSPAGRPDDRRVRRAQALGILEQLAGCFDALPRQATLSQWAEAWQELAEKTGGKKAPALPREDAAPGIDAADELAWSTLQEALRGTETLSRWMGRQAIQLDRRQALSALLDVLGNLRTRAAIDESGRVRILSAVGARTLDIPYLFFAGLSEKSFPAADRDERLYSEADYQRLINRGLPLVPRRERNREEMFLFYEVVTRATRRLFFSYPALDEAGQPLSPSPYLQEVELACGAGRIHRIERADLSPIPAGDEPLTRADFRVKALANAMAGNVLLLAGLIREETAPGRAAGVADNILAALGLLHQRQQREGFGAAEGMLLSNSARASLAAHFSPQRTFSATELERYAACPYRFFLEKVVRLEPVEELALALDYLARGRKTHELLALFHRRINGSRGRPTSPTELDDAQCQALLRETLDELFAHPAAGPVQAALAEVDRRLLLRWIGNYRRQHEVYDALWGGFASPPRPAHFEISFGRTLSGDNDPASTPQPLELGDGHATVRLSGSIDRVDLGVVGGQPVFNILDYKTGGASQFSPEAVARGHALQLPIYAIAAAQLLLAQQRAMPWQAGYWQVKDSGYKSRQSLRMAASHDGQPAAEPSWQALREVVVQTVLALVRGMRQGQFPVYNEDPNCTGHCPYRTVCRIHQIRSLEKTWQPPSAGN